MPATPIGSPATSYVPAVTSSTLHFGSIRAGDIIDVRVGAFGLGFPSWKITDNLGNGTDVDPVSGNPMYAKGAGQYGPGSFQKTLGFWAVSLIDGDLTITIETYTSSTLVTPSSQDQLNILSVWRFPKVYGIDQGSVGIGDFTPGVGFNNGYGSGDFTYADTLVLTGVITVGDAADLVSLTGDSILASIVQPSGGPFIPIKTLYLLGRSSTYTESVQGGRVDVKYTSNQGSGGLTSMTVMTFSIPLPKPAGLLRQYAVRGGAGEGSSAAGTDAQAEWNRPLVISPPYEVSVGDFLIVSVFVPSNPATIQPIPTDPYVTFDDYGPGFPILPPPYVNDYIQRIICPPTGSGSGSLSGTIATYTCMVQYIPVQQHPGWLAGGIFQVKLHVSGVGSDAVYQATAIGITVLTVAGPPTSIAVAGLKSVVQVVTDGLISSDVIPSVPSGTYLHAFAVLRPTGAMNSMSWAAMEDYTIRSSWDFFQFPSQITNRPRICGAAIMDKISPALDDYDAEVTAVLPGFAGSMGIVLLAVTVTFGPHPPPSQPGSPCDGVVLHSTDTQFELRRAYVELIPAPRIPVRGS